MSEELNSLSVLGIFASVQETFGEAKKKMADETRVKNQYLRMSKDGTYLVRILPLAPVIDADGNVQPMQRKGYEYPLRDLLLKIEDPSSTSKSKTQFVSVCNVKQAYPQVKEDLIDKFVSVACEKYADDEALCKKLKEGSFSGGLRWSSHRSMYVLDVNSREEGLQILSLTFAQYKELEDRKMNLWQKLLKKDPLALCPISSLDAYPVEITRKSESKTEYKISIAVEDGKDELSEEELQALLDAPQLPTVLYRYTRYHLEATIAFLKQVEEKMDIDVMNDEGIQDCIDQIKMALPADDQSHFKSGASSNDNVEDEANDINALWDIYDKLEADGLTDRSAEGQDLRASIKEFIEVNELSVRVSRTKTNLELLTAIDEEINDGVDHSEDEQEEEPVQATVDEEVDEEDNEPVQAPVSRRRASRNDDTNEPAARPERRTARPARRK